MTSKGEKALLDKVELLMELRGYQIEDVHNGEETVDIKASGKDPNEKVLIHVITKSYLKSDNISVERIRKVDQILSEEDIDKIIVFGNKFTDSARKTLLKKGIEFFSQKNEIISSLNPQEVYLKIRDSVDALCQIKCGHVPETESECEGYSESPVECAHCAGTGQVEGSYREHECPICGGKGSRKSHYSCSVRLLSDNADFHFEHGWITLLQNDLLFLLKTLRDSKREHQKHLLLTVD